MRLGAFVIHGNNADTLGACLDGLQAVADEVLAVDSASTDGSAALVRARGVRAIMHPWEGYGSARAVAARALEHCDYLLFLDSDERLEAPAIASLHAWKESVPTALYYRLRLHDWAELPGHRFLFRREYHRRLIRRGHASWEPRMIVHESLRPEPSPVLDATIEHRFATSLAAREDKEDRYALLWALRAANEGRRGKVAWLQRPAHTLRNGLLKGAVLRGGADGARLAWLVSRYHARKYEYLREVRAGRHAEALTALKEERYRDLFAQLARGG